MVCCHFRSRGNDVFVGILYSDCSIKHTCVELSVLLERVACLALVCEVLRVQTLMSNVSYAFYDANTMLGPFQYSVSIYQYTLWD